MTTVTSALVVQLARLGDLLQSIPAILGIRAAYPDLLLDLLCPAHLAPIGRMVPGLNRVVEWDGTVWHRWAGRASTGLEPALLVEAEKQLDTFAPSPYDCAYVLNQHPRSLLAGALLARETKGPRLDGPIGQILAPWASYLREAARTGIGCKVHLADVFCGLCDVAPPGKPPFLVKTSCEMPPALEPIGRCGEPWVGLIVGAGSDDRLIPMEVWQSWIIRFLHAAPSGRVVLLGLERERGLQLQNFLPSLLMGRVWDMTGRTSLAELVSIVSRCHVVIGSDTGPLHLAAAAGTRVFGWYFARARVHETGPYGFGHVVWQAIEETAEGDKAGRMDVRPIHWPIEESVAVLMEGIDRSDAPRTPGWSIWISQCDQWGAYYTEVGGSLAPPPEREGLWHELSPLVLQRARVA